MTYLRSAPAGEYRQSIRDRYQSLRMPKDWRKVFSKPPLLRVIEEEAKDTFRGVKRRLSRAEVLAIYREFRPRRLSFHGSMLRVRFYVPPETGPVKEPPHPWWVTGYSRDGDVIVAFVDDRQQVRELWPQASELHFVQRYPYGEYGFTERFPAP